MSDWCARCDCDLACRKAFVLGGERHCLRCAVLRTSLLRRSALTGAVVGCVLTAVNEGPALIGGAFRAGQAWQVAMNFVVPFLVSTWGALSGSLSPSGDRSPGDRR